MSRVGRGKESALLHILMLLALTSFSIISSERNETNLPVFRKSIGEKKLVIHKQLWTKPAAEYRG